MKTGWAKRLWVHGGLSRVVEITDERLHHGDMVSRDRAGFGPIQDRWRAKPDLVCEAKKNGWARAYLFGTRASVDARTEADAMSALACMVRTFGMPTAAVMYIRPRSSDGMTIEWNEDQIRIQHQANYENTNPAGERLIEGRQD